MICGRRVSVIAKTIVPLQLHCQCQWRKTAVAAMEEWGKTRLHWGNLTRRRMSHSMHKTGGMHKTGVRPPFGSTKTNINLGTSTTRTRLGLFLQEYQ